MAELNFKRTFSEEAARALAEHVKNDPAPAIKIAGSNDIVKLKRDENDALGYSINDSEDFNPFGGSDTGSNNELQGFKHANNKYSIDFKSAVAYVGTFESKLTASDRQSISTTNRVTNNDGYGLRASADDYFYYFRIQGVGSTAVPHSQKVGNFVYIKGKLDSAFQSVDGSYRYVYVVKNPNTETGADGYNPRSVPVDMYFGVPNTDSSNGSDSYIASYLFDFKNSTSTDTQYIGRGFIKHYWAQLIPSTLTLCIGIILTESFTMNDIKLNSGIMFRIPKGYFKIALTDDWNAEAVL